MRLCRLLALLLGALTAAFVAYQYSLDGTSFIILVGLAGAAGLIVLGAALPIKRRINRVLLGAGVVLYVLGISVVIAMSYDTAQALLLRGGLISFLIAGLLLAIFWSYLNRAKPRRGFHRYYDR